MDPSARVPKSSVHSLNGFCKPFAFQVFALWKNLGERTPKIRTPKIDLYVGQPFHQMPHLFATSFACRHCQPDLAAAGTSSSKS